MRRPDKWMKDFIQNKGGLRTETAFWLNLSVFLKRENITVEGQEVLDQLRDKENTGDERPVVFAVTHLDDIAVQLLTALLLENGFAVHLTHQTQQREMRSMNTLIKLVGGKRFLPIDSWTKIMSNQDGKKQPVIKGGVNWQNYKKISEQRPPYLVVAAHNPNKNLDQAVLPDKPGKAPILTALALNAIIVPVAIDIYGDKPIIAEKVGPEQLLQRGKRKARVIFGKPIALQHEPEMQQKQGLIDQILQAIYVPDDRHKDQNQHYDRHGVDALLENLGGKLMRELAALLPVQKRGRWDTQNSDDL